MPDTTKMVDLGLINAAEFWGGSSQRADNANLAYINRIRTALNDGLNWSVTRASKLAGFGSHTAHGCVIQRLDGAGAPTEDSWFLSLSGYRSSGTSTQPQDIYQNSTQAGAYYSYMGGNAFTAGFIGLHYNPNSLTDGYDIGAVANDFDPPTTSLKSNTPGFFGSADMPKGIMSCGNNPGMIPWILFYDPTINAMGLIICDKNENRLLRHYIVSGRIAECRRAGDTNDGIIVGFECPDGVGGADAFSSYVINGLDDAGNQESFQYVDHNSYTYQNQPHGSPSKFDGDKIKIASPTYDKGWIRPDVAAIQGRYGSDFGFVFESTKGSLVKINESISVLMAFDDYPSVPFLNWPYDGHSNTFPDTVL